MVGVNFDILRGSISLPLDLSISYYFFVVNDFFCERNNTKKTSRAVKNGSGSSLYPPGNQALRG